MASVISAGTTSGTSLNLTGDTSGQLQLQTNGTTTAVTIDTSQNVGIGTSSPGVKLDVVGSQIRVQQPGTVAGYTIKDTTNNRSAFFNYTQGSSLFIGAEGNTPIIFANTDSLTTRATIDASGNLGLGVTPSAWNSAYKAFQFGAGSIATVTTGEAAYLHNAFINSGGSYAYVNTAAAARYSQAGGVHYWFNAPSGTAGNAITFTQAMTLDASGRLQVSPSSGTGMVAVGDTAGGGTYNCGIYRGAAASVGSGDYLNAGGYSGIVFTTGAAALGSQTERMRIDSSGNLLVGTTSAVGLLTVNGGGNNTYLKQTTGSGYVLQTDATVNGSTYYFVNFLKSGTGISNITSNGTTISYNTGSDYRLKQNIQPIANALETVSKLKPSTWDWKEFWGTGGSIGFVAHELAEVIPECVTGEKDAVDADGNPIYQGIDTSFLVATLTASIQELNAKVEAQAAEIATLKGTK